jgi:hypothetical protein
MALGIWRSAFLGNRFVRVPGKATSSSATEVTSSPGAPRGKPWGSRKGHSPDSEDSRRKDEISPLFLWLQRRGGFLDAREEPLDLAALFAQADAAMYAAKRERKLSPE